MRMEPMLDSYNENSALQATCQTVGNPMLAHMASTYGAGLPKDAAGVRLAEYGCSGGRNSYAPLHTIVSALRRARKDLVAECVLEDLPSNTWQQVMAVAPRLTAAFDGRVQVLCAGTSFYNQVCSDASLDLAYSYVASHFLSGSLPLESHVMMHEGAPRERSAWEARAATDWESFLLLRARELKKGGKLLVSTMSRDASGYSWKEFSHLVWDSVRRASSKGSLSAREAEALCIPACLRSEAEILAPFSSSSLVSASFAVDSLQFARTEVDGERSLPADVLAPILRRRVEAVWGGMFLTQLGRLGRTTTSSRQVMGEVWDLFEEEIARDTSRGWLDMQAFYLQLTRK
jgi:gibberellin A4 carboxyl methyltransferase